MGYNWDFSIIWTYREAFFRGALVTLQLVALSSCIGFAVGLPLGLMRSASSRLPRYLATPPIELFRSTPTLVQLVWIYYALPILIGVRIGPVAATSIGLGLHSAAYVAEIFRAGIASIEKGQFLASKAIGMSYFTCMRRIILPQAVRRMIPPFINEFANLIKLTTLGSVLAVSELLHASDNLINTVFRPLEIYSALAVVFALIIYPMILCSRQLELYWSRRA